MQNIPEVNNSTTITTAEFVKLTIYNDFSNIADTTVYTFSSSYQDETIDGVVYSALGGLLSVGTQNKDLRVTAGDTNISLSGVDGNNIVAVLANKIRGSEVEVIRGFYDDEIVLQNTYPRFTGIITNYAISQEREGADDNFIVTISASSYKTVLENRIAGRKTNKESWRFFDPSDSSMDQVYSLSGVSFDFGMPVTNKTLTGGGGGIGGAGGPDADRNMDFF